MTSFDNTIAELIRQLSLHPLAGSKIVDLVDSPDSAWKEDFLRSVHHALVVSRPPALTVESLAATYRLMRQQQTYVEPECIIVTPAGLDRIRALGLDPADPDVVSKLFALLDKPTRDPGGTP